MMEQVQIKANAIQTTPQADKSTPLSIRIQVEAYGLVRFDKKIPAEIWSEL